MIGCTAQYKKTPLGYIMIHFEQYSTNATEASTRWLSGKRQQQSVSSGRLNKLYNLKLLVTYATVIYLLHFHYFQLVDTEEKGWMNTHAVTFPAYGLKKKKISLYYNEQVLINLPITGQHRSLISRCKNFTSGDKTFSKRICQL